jgi:hypothetical protein
MLQPDQLAIVEAIKSSYPTSASVYDGWLVIDEGSTLIMMDLAAQNIFETELENATGSNLAVFLPSAIKPQHQAFVSGEFAKLKEAIQDPSKPYRGRFMGAAPTASKVRYLSAKTARGTDISIGIEFQPLIANNKPYFVAFLSRNPETKSTELSVTQEQEAEKVIADARIAFGFQVVDQTSSRLGRLFNWYVDIFKGLPAHKVLALITFFFSLGGLGYGIAYLYKVVRPSTIQQFNVPILDYDDEPSPSKTPSNGDKKK